MISGALYQRVATYSVKKPVWSCSGSAIRARPKSQICGRCKRLEHQSASWYLLDILSKAHDWTSKKTWIKTAVKSVLIFIYAYSWCKLYEDIWIPFTVEVEKKAALLWPNKRRCQSHGLHTLNMQLYWTTKKRLEEHVFPLLFASQTIITPSVHKS